MTIDAHQLLAAIHEARAIDWRHEGSCFGFARHIANRLGADVPDYNFPDSRAGAVLFYENFHEHVRPIARGDVRVGDIITFKYRSSFHIGIYVGERRMAHWRGVEHGIVFERIDVPPICRGELGFYRAMTNGATA